MSVIAQDSQTLSNVVKSEHQAELGYCRDVKEFDATNGAVAVGVLLGLNASGKFEKAIQTGTYTKLAIAVQGPVTSGGLASAIGLVRGPASISKAGIVWHASYDLAAEKNAVYATLEAQGIQCLDSF